MDRNSFSGRSDELAIASGGLFLRRLITELANFEDGWRRAAAEMGVAEQVIYALGNGVLPSPDDLESMIAWLAERADLTQEEIEDYRHIRAVASSQDTPAVKPVPYARPVPRASTRLPALSRTRTTAILAVGTVVVAVIVVVSVLITVMVVRSKSEAASARPRVSASRTSAASVPGKIASAAPDTTAAPSAPGASVAPTSSIPAGTLLNHYTSFKLPGGYSIPLVSSGVPQPQTGEYGDLAYCSQCDSEFASGTGQLALLSGSLASYGNCKADTVFGTELSVAQGQTICFYGHGVVAAATMTGQGSSGGIDYAILNVSIWEG